MSNSTSNFKVLIIGGGVAGVCLANTLERAGIDFTLLEAYPEIAPQVGASFLVDPPTLRVLDQMDMLESVWEKAPGIKTRTHRMSDGRPFSHIVDKIVERHGYPGVFMERQGLISTMWDGLQSKRKVHCNKKVISIEETDDDVTAITSDGSRYTGQLLVGADGVHSKVRKHLASQLPPEIGAKMNDYLTCQYGCIFGICNPTGDLQAGAVNTTHCNGHSVLMPCAKDNRVYFFLVFKLDKTYAQHEVPRFTERDLMETAEKHKNQPCTETVKFGDVFANRIVANILPLHEGVLDTWYKGRVTLLGDAAHKFTPNGGWGGNFAIESVVLLSNYLYESLNQPFKRDNISLPELTTLLQRYEDHQKPRARCLCHFSKTITKIHAMDGAWYKTFVKFGMRCLQMHCWKDSLGPEFVVAPSLKYLKPSSKPHTIPYNDEITVDPKAAGLLQQSNWVSLAPLTIAATGAVVAVAMMLTKGSMNGSALKLSSIDLGILKQWVAA